MANTSEVSTVLPRSHGKPHWAPLGRNLKSCTKKLQYGKAWWMRYYALGGVDSKHPPVAMTLVGQTQRQMGGSARWGMAISIAISGSIIPS